MVSAIGGRVLVLQSNGFYVAHAGLIGKNSPVPKSARNALSNVVNVLACAFSSELVTSITLVRKQCARTVSSSSFLFICASRKLKVYRKIVR